MATILIQRGANVDFANSEGQTALSICVQRQLQKQIDYLLYKGANQHILDIHGLDSCDYAKQNGISRTMLCFNNCNRLKQLIPLLPDMTYPEIECG